MKMIFDETARGFVLDAFNKKVDAEGYIVEKSNCDHRVLTPTGDEILADEFAGVRKGSVVFIKSDIASLVQAAQAIPCI